MVVVKDMKFPNCCVDCNLVELDEIDNFYCGYTHHYCNNQNNERNSDCPLVETEERKVGKWESDGHGHIVCTACNEVNVTIWKSKYCPCCGAEMRGSENE